MIYHVFPNKFGKKVYLSTVSPTYPMLTEWGIKVFDFRDIESSSFHDFSSFSREDGEKNHEIGQRYFSLQATLRCWEALIAKLKDGLDR